MHRLPKPRLVPLCIETPAIRHFICEHRDSLSNEDRARYDDFRAHCAARLDRERPWRIANQRFRLYACHWAQYKPGWLRPLRGLLPSTRAERHGDVGPKWLGE